MDNVQSNLKYKRDCSEAYKNFRHKRDLSKLVKNCVWDGDIQLPTKPKELSNICGYGVPQKERNFPYYDKEWVKEIDNKDLDDLIELPEWYLKRFQPKQLSITKANFLHQEWERRRYGFWFYNYNELTGKTHLEYVTGTHYFTLQYWLVPIAKKLDNGRVINVRSNPRFTDMNRDWHYALEWTKRSAGFDGMLFYGARRIGKTFIVTADMYFETISHKEYMSAIQSKNDDDAKEVLKRLVDSWQRLPQWLKPVDTGETDVRNRLVFREPKKRSSKGEKKTYKEVLNSEIESFSAKETALDSQQFNYILGDEVGKYVNGSASERWNVNRQALYSGGYRVGFGLLTSTVEEMEKGGGYEAKILWDGAELIETDDGVITSSNGLMRLFFPSIYGRIGEYMGEEMVTPNGYTNWEVGEKWIASQYAGKKGKDYLSIKRKHPMEWEDMFLVTDETSPFDEEKLLMQKKHNEYILENRNPLIRGNFVWRNGVPFGEVDWIPNERGKFLRYDWNPKDSINEKKLIGRTFHPKSNICWASLDPYDHMAVKDMGRSSSAAAHVITMSAEFNVPTFVCQYVNRPKSPNVMYNDILKMCVYYSSTLLTENNKSGIINYFEDKGHLGYLMTDPYEKDDRKMVYGMSTTGENRRAQLIDNLITYVYDYVGEQEDGTYNTFPFQELIKDMVSFNPAKWTPHDLTVSAMLAVTAYMTGKRKIMSKPVYKESKLDDWFRVYNKQHKFGGSTI